MSSLCKNCNTETTDLYCAHCGQSTSTKRIDWAFCTKEFIFNNFTFHKGMLFTVKSLIVNPKKMVENYLSGKRVGYTGAVQFFLFILIFKGITSLIFGDVENNNPGSIEINGVSSVIDLGSYRKPMIFIFTIISCLGNYLVYKSRKFSLAEHFFLNFYIIGMSFFFSVVYSLVTFFKFPDNKIIVMAVVNTLFYIRIFYDKKIRVIDFIKGIWCMTLNVILVVIVTVIAALLYAYQQGMLNDVVKVSMN